MGEVLRVISKTVLFYCLVILGATFLMYTLLWSAPGTIVDVLCAGRCTKEDRVSLQKEWNLNKPLPVQYGLWLGRSARFKFGTSATIRQGQPINKMLRPAIKRTTALVLGAALLTLLFSFFLAWRPIHPFRRWVLKFGQLPLVVLSFAPLYVLAYWVVQLTTRMPPWLVKKGFLAKKTLYKLQDIDFLPFANQLNDDVKWYFLGTKLLVAMILLAIGNSNLVEQLSGFRTELNELKEQHFMRAVRARGASFTLHLMHNLLLPLVQFFSTRAVLLLGTVVIVEKVLNINGVGFLLWQATEQRDTPVVLAIALFATVLACLLQMCNEIALQLIDPRLRKK